MKAIGLSILGMILFLGMLLGVIFLFTINWMLGIVGIILIAIFPRMLFSKAVDAANGRLTEMFAKFVAPILTAIVGVFLILGAFFWF